MKANPNPGFTQSGRTWSAERRAAWGDAQRGKKRKPHTIESRLLMSKIVKSKRPRKQEDESATARKLCEWKIWREMVFKRDGFACLKCGATGGRLQPHHIENFASNVALRYAVDNGATLCIQCHKDFHRVFGKKRNNQAQLDRFLSHIKENGGVRALLPESTQ